jgi:hypothetical protein
MCDICNATSELYPYDCDVLCLECLTETLGHDKRIADLLSRLEPHLKAWLRCNKGVAAMDLDAALFAIGDKLVEGSYSKALIAEVIQ